MSIFKFDPSRIIHQLRMFIKDITGGNRDEHNKAVIDNEILRVKLVNDKIRLFKEVGFSDEQIRHMIEREFYHKLNKGSSDRS